MLRVLRSVDMGDGRINLSSLRGRAVVVEKKLLGYSFGLWLQNIIDKQRRAGVSDPHRNCRTQAREDRQG
jgi:hypothetical protein